MKAQTNTLHMRHKSHIRVIGLGRSRSVPSHGSVNRGTLVSPQTCLLELEHTEALSNLFHASSQEPQCGRYQIGVQVIRFVLVGRHACLGGDPDVLAVDLSILLEDLVQSPPNLILVLVHCCAINVPAWREKL